MKDFRNNLERFICYSIFVNEIKKVGNRNAKHKKKSSKEISFKFSKGK